MVLPLKSNPLYKKFYFNQNCAHKINGPQDPLIQLCMRRGFLPSPFRTLFTLVDPLFIYSQAPLMLSSEIEQDFGKRITKGTQIRPSSMQYYISFVVSVLVIGGDGSSVFVCCWIILFKQQIEIQYSSFEHSQPFDSHTNHSPYGASPFIKKNTYMMFRNYSTFKLERA